MAEKITERAKGRWKEILLALGVPSKVLNGKNQPCPFCGGTDRFRFTNYEGRGGFICSQCQGGSGFEFLMRLKGWDFKAAAIEIEGIIGSCKPDRKIDRSEADKRKAMNDLWDGAKSIQVSDPVGKYLARRCGLAAFPSSLRCIPSLRYFGSPHSFPAMLAKLTAPNDKPCSIHRTYLTEEGHKAPVEASRRMMPGAIAKGSAVRLSPIAPVMGIAEGVETALSATALFGVPTWAALNSELLRAWEPPVTVEKVIIYGDNDQNFTGQHAAFALAHRLAVLGVQVETRIPEEIGFDWNDVLCKSKVSEECE